MSTIEELIEIARRGEGDHGAAILEHIRGFQEIVLRGAGRFGAAFGAFLLRCGAAAGSLTYWDIRADELRTLHGCPVLAPFSSSHSKERTLVINCIPNGSLSGSVSRREVLDAGYENYLSGMALFEALMCSLRPETGFRPEVCIETTFCNWCACKRLPSMVYDACHKGASPTGGERLVFSVATFVIGQRCTLQCTHCGQYMNHYPATERVNFPLARVLTDIERIFAAVDAIGYVSVIGGEPFLHPGLSRIVEAILAKPNFGVLGITTNGVCEMSDEHLRSMDNGRTRIIFSDYTPALSDKQKRLFRANVEKVEASGINYTVGRPVWAMPASLIDQRYSADVRRGMKAGCSSTETCKTIQNGVYYPCSTTAGVGSHRLADYPTDRVVIDQTHSGAALRAAIRQVDDRAEYQSCGHCGGGGEPLSVAGEQGSGERYSHIGMR